MRTESGFLGWRKPRIDRDNGSALVTVMIFVAVGTLMLASVAQWASTHNIMAARQVEFERTQYVAEAGTEKIFAAIRNSLLSTGQSPSQAVLNGFATTWIPTAADDPIFGSYQYITSSGQLNQIVVTLTGASSIQSISSGTYVGLNSLSTPYQIIARANGINRPISLTTGVMRTVQIQQIPIFQFAIFYNLDLEMEPGPNMTINGRVHTNNNLYVAPLGQLVFNNNVTVGQNVYNNPMPGDTHESGWIPPAYNGTLTDQVNPLNLPVGTSSPHALLELPPGGTDPLASSRFYDLAGLRIQVNNTGVSATNGSGQTVTLSSAVISTSKTLYNYREGKTIAITQIDLGQLAVKGQMPANGIIYVDDTRTGTAENAVRLIDGSSLPTTGLTVATPNPIYVQGNYNTADAPAALFADSINILSGNWNDANSNQPLTSRTATNTTVNAGFFAGIVPTSGNNYSGGVENFPRFLENWTGSTFTYTGSMVAMFASQIGTGKWQIGGNYYNPPTRNWSFDVQFMDPTRLPPGTPSVRTISRVSWAQVN